MYHYKISPLPEYKLEEKCWLPTSVACFFLLKSILCYYNPVFCLLFSWYNFFHLFTFNLPLPSSLNFLLGKFKVNYRSYTSKYIAEAFWFLNPWDNLCFFTGVFLYCYLMQLLIQIVWLYQLYRWLSICNLFLFLPFPTFYNILFQHTL